MPSKSKAKGNRVERLIVDAFTEAGHDCKRAWGSNGQALGMPETVDNLANLHGQELRIQAKARKRIADFMKPPKDCNAAVLKADREDMLIVFRLTDFLALVDSLTENSEPDTPAE